MTRAIFINQNLYYIGNSKVSAFMTHYTVPTSYTFSNYYAIIWSSQTSSASYTLENSGIETQYSLSNYLRNNFTTSPFISISSLALTQHTTTLSSINYYSNSAYNCPSPVNNAMVASVPLIQYFD